MIHLGHPKRLKICCLGGEIEFDLLSNATDSLRRAVELLAFNEIDLPHHACLKHAVMGSAHCIELLLKERLRRINPAFVWENIDRYPNLDARTVTVDTAICRLKTIGNISFSQDDERNLKALRLTRNAIEHYEWHASEREAKVILGTALSFAFSFAQNELGIDLSVEYKDDDRWKNLLEEDYDFARAHGKRLEEKLRSRGEYPACCDLCGALTVPERGGGCELCGHWQSAEDSFD